MHALYVFLPLLLPLHYSHDAKLDDDYARYSGDNAHFQLIILRGSAVRILYPMGDCGSLLNAMQCLLVDTS